MEGVRESKTRCSRYGEARGYSLFDSGMYKDQIYFMGAINVLKNRHRLNFNELHCGKINIEDCLKLSEKGQISYH